MVYIGSLLLVSKVNGLLVLADKILNFVVVQLILIDDFKQVSFDSFFNANFLLRRQRRLRKSTLFLRVVICQDWLNDVILHCCCHRTQMKWSLKSSFAFVVCWFSFVVFGGCIKFIWKDCTNILFMFVTWNWEHRARAGLVRVCRPDFKILG